MSVALTKRADSQRLVPRLEAQLRDQIMSGKYAAGHQLPGVRALAREFEVSVNTLSIALRRLAAQGLVVLHPSRGAFVTDTPEEVNTHLVDVIFGFPEASMGRNSLRNGDSWGIAHETYRGLLDAGKKHDLRIHYIHWDEHQSTQAQLHKIGHLTALRGGVLTSWQTAGLELYLKKQGLPTITFADHSLDTTDTVYRDLAGNMKLLVESLVQSGCRRIGRLYCTNSMITQQLKQNTFIAEVVRAGMEFCCDWDIGLDGFIDAFPVQEMAAKINLDDSDIPDCFYIQHNDIVPNFFEFLRAGGKQIGRDIKVCGYASNMGFHNIRPTMTYLDIDCYTCGFRAGEILALQIAGKPVDSDKFRVTGTLIKGEST